MKKKVNEKKKKEDCDDEKWKKLPLFETGHLSDIPYASDLIFRRLR
jgi:hypothetical protein